MAQACEVVVHEWDEFFRLANLFPSEGWTFRGQKDASWTLTSSIERTKHDREVFMSKVGRGESDNKIGALIRYLSVCSEFPDELSAIKEFRNYAIRQGFDFGERWVEYLAAMQHYGTPTRLLDFTSSILTALYFAFEDPYKLTERAVWAVRIRPLEDAIADVRNQCAQRRVKLPIYGNYEDAASWIIENPNECRKVKLSGLVLPLRLPGNNARLVAQNGMFLFPVNRISFSNDLAASLGLKQLQIERPTKVEMSSVGQALRKSADNVDLIKMTFDTKTARDVCRVFNMANITARTIYPGIEGIAKSITYKYQ